MSSNSGDKFCLNVVGSYMCSCVGQKFERAFTTRSCPAIKRSSLYSAKRVLPLRQKCWSARSMINAFVFYLEGGLENPQERMEIREKILSNFVSVRDLAEKGQKH